MKTGQDPRRAGRPADVGQDAQPVLEKLHVLLREVEAESVALLCCEALNLEGAEYCRGYIQNWLRPSIGNADVIPEKSAQKIFRAADQILRAGRRQANENEH